ncbi:MAG: ATP-dependent sacrificial sulfur transferase LarE [Desulfobacteraceae bacterium]
MGRTGIAIAKEECMPLGPEKDLWERLLERVSSLGSVLVAFSGGADSALLLKAASEALGGKAAAATAEAPIFPERERLSAVRLAGKIGVRHRLFEFAVMEIEEFRANGPERCYHCKRVMALELASLARSEGLAAVAEGTNADDLNDYRPGIRAAREARLVSPLAEIGMGKADVRRLSRALELETWDRPSRACLASRIPYGKAITLESLRRVDRAEEILEQAGIRQARVRDHDGSARLEVPPEHMPRVIDRDFRESLVAGLRELGFRHVSLDLEGYVSGSLNRGLPNQTKGKTGS